MTQFKGPEIVVTPPGPKAQEILAKDRKYISPSYGRPYPAVIARGSGIYTWDVDGNRYMDLSSGIGVTNTGHCHPEVVQAITHQASELIHMSGTDFYYPVQVQLAEKLAEIAPGAPNKRVFLANSGAEAIEAAMKLARYKRQRPIFLAFFGAFHGRTFGALSLTASKEVQRRHFAPLLPQVVHIPYPDPYRTPFGVKPEEVTDIVLAYLKEEVFERVAPPEDIAAMFVEPVQGEGGYIIPPRDFFPRLKEMLEEHNILFVDDEIQAGMGRTGRMFAIEHWGVIPDMITVAKGIASGVPLGAMIARASLMDWPPGTHASTFGGNPVACRAALKTIELLENGLIENAERVGAVFLQRLQALQEQFEFVDNARGLGLMLAIDIVKDRETKEPDPKLRQRILMEAFRRGLLVLDAGRSAIRFIPPLIITEEEVHIAMDIFEETLRNL